MNCRSVQDQMADMSAGQLPSGEIAALQAHCAACPQCRHEWELFQSTLLLLSTLSQPLPEPEVSGQMWHACSEEIFLRIEARRLAVQPVSVWARVGDWARLQPRWGWAALCGAIVVFGSVWLLTPGDEVQNVVAQAPLQAPLQAPADGGPVVMFNAPGAAPSTGSSMAAADFGARRVQFALPPRSAASAVNYHAAMSFDPFADHVASTLVSTSAGK